MDINISYIECSGDVVNNYYETIEPRYYNHIVTLEELSYLVTSPRRQFSPFSYSDYIKSANSWNNDLQDCLILDFDDGLSIKEAMDIFNSYSYLIYTTKSHQVDKKGIVCDRFRVILPAENIPKGELYFAMMEELAKLLPIDKQVNTKTGSFLGNDGITYLNYGNRYDCSYLVSSAEYRLANQQKKKETKQRKRLEKLSNDVYMINVENIKNYLDIQDTLEILEDLGYEVNHFTRKFKLRPEERTASAKVYNQGYIYDYGSGFKGDIIDIVQDRLSIGFKEAMDYIRRYVEDKNCLDDLIKDNDG